MPWLFAFTCGRLEGELGHLMEGGEGRIGLPIPSYLIEHPKGTVLFDTGMHPDCQHDPAGRVGARHASCSRSTIGRARRSAPGSTAIGRDPARIDLVVNSHFHFDHVGGNALIPNATMVVQRREWDAGMDPDIAARRGFNPRDFDLGHKLRLVDGEHDVFGDGSVVCLPTHGHTPGHQSLKVRLGCAATSCWPPIPAISAAPCANAGCRVTSTTARRCSPRSTGSPRSKRAARASFSATTPNSGKRVPQAPAQSSERIQGTSRHDRAAARDPVRPRRHDAGRVRPGRIAVAARSSARSSTSLAPLDPAAVIAAIQDSSRDLWADPARHKHWRHRIGEARRQIVANAFAALAAAGHPVPDGRCAT